MRCPCWRWRHNHSLFSFSFKLNTIAHSHSPYQELYSAGSVGIGSTLTVALDLLLAQHGLKCPCWLQLRVVPPQSAGCSWLPVVMWGRAFIQHSSHHFTKLQSMVTRIISYWLSGALSAKIAWFALFPAAVSLHFSKLAGAVPPSGYQFLPPRQRLDKINTSTIFTQTSCCKRTKITRSV